LYKCNGAEKLDINKQVRKNQLELKFGIFFPSFSFFPPIPSFPFFPIEGEGFIP
jgi:hypothetical protein